jgi:polysaccharide export outer membrane protein
MRHGRRRKLIAGIGTALGLCAAGAGCQSAGRTPAVAARPAATVTAPVALGPASPGPAAGAAPRGGNDVCWRAASPAGDATPPGVVAVTFHPSGAQPEVPETEKTDGLPPLTLQPEPVRGQPPEGKKGDATKDDKELPPPHPLPGGGPVVHAVPTVPVPDVPRELAKRALPTYVIEPPDILLIEAVPREGLLKNDQRIAGQHAVRPDGTVGLGIYGDAFVGGLTIEQAREAIAAQIRKRVTNFSILDLSVDVLAYNSKFYYVITDGGGYGEQVYPFLITGSETVLDALGRINGLPPVADKTKIWVARRGPGDMGHILPVDWVGIAQRGAAATNYQLMPGDRVYVKADHWISTDAWLNKRLSPIERLFGATLLGSQTVNSIRNKTTSGTTP